MNNNPNTNNNDNAFSKLLSSSTHNNPDKVLIEGAPIGSNFLLSSNSNHSGSNNLFGLSGLQVGSTSSGGMVGSIGGVGSLTGGGGPIPSGVGGVSSMGGGNGGAEELLPLVIHLTNPEQVRRIRNFFCFLFVVPSFITKRMNR